MTETETLIAEVRQLRADVARLHAAHTPVHIRHGWLPYRNSASFIGIPLR